MNITLPKEKVLKYLGHRGQDISCLSLLLNETIKNVCKISNPKYIIDYQNVTMRNEQSITLQNQLYLKGKAINKVLKGCQKVAIIIATIGMDFDKKLMSLQQTQPLESIIFNAAGSAYIEEVMDELNNEVIIAHPKDLTTKRFSAGYGDLPLQTNKHIIDIYNATRRLGILINESFLMTPIKSVTAFIGIKEDK